MNSNKSSLLDESIRNACGSKATFKYRIKVDATLQLLKYLELARESKCACGWKATDLLVRLRDKKTFVPSHQEKTLTQLSIYGTGDSTADEVIMKLLCDAAWPGTSRQYKEWVSGFAFTVLESFGLVKKDEIDAWLPSDELCDLILKDEDLD
jgi:hypothetical protein